MERDLGEPGCLTSPSIASLERENNDNDKRSYCRPMSFHGDDLLTE